MERWLREAPHQSGPQRGQGCASTATSILGVAEQDQDGARDAGARVQGGRLARDRSHGVASKLRLPRGGGAADTGSGAQ
eukprot:2328535-Pleurochrysis_carterae.AAC.2